MLPIAGQERYYGGTGVGHAQSLWKGPGFGQPGKVGRRDWTRRYARTGALLILNDFPEAELCNRSPMISTRPSPYTEMSGTGRMDWGPMPWTNWIRRYERVRIAWWLGPHQTSW